MNLLPARFRRPLLFLGGAVLLLRPLSASAVISFVPIDYKHAVDGYTFHDMIFKDDKTEIVYRPVRDWTYSSEPSRITFHPNNAVQAEASIMGIPATGLMKLDETGTDRLKKAALSLVPKGAENLTLLSAEQNTIVMLRHDTIEFKFKYTFYGQAFQLSVLFLPLEQQIVTFKTLAHESDFAAVYKAFHGSCFSWRFLHPDATPTPSPGAAAAPEAPVPAPAPATPVPAPPNP